MRVREGGMLETLAGTLVGRGGPTLPNLEEGNAAKVAKVDPLVARVAAMELPAPVAIDKAAQPLLDEACASGLVDFDRVSLEGNFTPDEDKMSQMFLVRSAPT